ncbi:hypothetical protein BDV93DRAFT_563179 [Ceratobasidium sp. AG-I]|nr:hypothetical protein BDV93DRAFT_563179 [Ceratobasidium sp. AG-I]
MPKRKVDSYAISESSDADSETEQPPSKKKVFVPPLLTKSAFKRTNDSASSRPGSSLACSEPSTAPGQKPIAPAATRTSFPTPRETLSTKLWQSDRFGPTASIENSDDDGAPTSPMVAARAKVGSSRSHPAPPPAISWLVVERQLNKMSEKVG